MDARRTLYSLLTSSVPDEIRARIGAFADINAVRTARLGVG